MITDAAFARLAAATYTTSATWTGISGPVHAGGESIQAYLGGAGDLTHIGFRGSKTPREWAFDFLAVPVKEAEHPKLGFVHAGFLLAALTVYNRVHLVAAAAHNTRKPFALYGHSLGGALALITGALLAADGIAVERIVTFAAPRVGYHDYAAQLAGVAVDEYRFGNDPVPQVPLFMEHARDVIRIGAARPGIAGALSCHHIENYVDAVAALEAPKAA